MTKNLAVRSFVAVAAMSLLAVSPIAAQQTTGSVSASPAVATPANAGSQPVLLKLNDIDEELRSEGPAQEGLWQRMILSEPDTRLVLLTFDENGKKANHSVPGRATITVVEGEIDFDVAGTTHNMKAGDVIVLEPHTMHNLTAKTKSKVLVNINMRTNAGAPGSVGN